MCGPLMERYTATVIRVKRIPRYQTIYFCVDTKVNSPRIRRVNTSRYSLTIVRRRRAKHTVCRPAPHEDELSITVKKLVSTPSGSMHFASATHLIISAAYGYFNPETSRPLVSVPAVDLLQSGVSRRMSCIETVSAWHTYSLATSMSMKSFRTELDAHQDVHASFAVHHHITRDVDTPIHMHHGRIDLDACVKAVEGEVNYLL